MDVRELICLRTAGVWNMPEVALAAGWQPCPVCTANDAMDLYKRKHQGKSMKALAA